MAIKVKREKDGKMKTTYTGFDKVSHAFGNTLEKIKSGAKKVVKSYKDTQVNYKKAQASKELDDIGRAFGSVDNYVKLYPDYSKRADELKKKAYGN